MWVKLRREVDALNGEQPTFEQIKDMKYLKYVINESTSPSRSIRVIWGTSHGLVPRLIAYQIHSTSSTSGSPIQYTYVYRGHCSTTRWWPGW